MDVPQALSDSKTWPEWGTVLIALIALVQPWLIAAYRKYLRRGAVVVYETRTIEVGFSTLGPTIALFGTLQALYQESFVRSSSVRIVRTRDNAQIHLPWRAFRPIPINFSDPTMGTLELASAFLLTPAVPFKFNIIFASDELTKPYRPMVEKVKASWMALRSQVGNNGSPRLPSEADATMVESAALNAAFDSFLNSPESAALWTKLNNECFWLAGKYELWLRVETARPDQAFEKHWRFALTEQDCEQLRLNIIGILREICVLDSRYHFAYQEYERVGDRDETKRVS